MYLIDTNTVRFFRDKNPLVFNKFEEYEGQIFLCAIVQSECLFGSVRIQNFRIEKFYDILFDKYKYLVYGKKEAKNFAEIKAYLQKSGNNVEDFDIMIAAVALANNLTLVTNNTKHFKNVKGLKVEDWSK
jgi:tRNA(fMet)-specific endonuclease VapC